MHKSRLVNNKRLKKGEYGRPNGTFEYKWSDRSGKRHSIYAKTLPELRAKEESIKRDLLNGIKCVGTGITINQCFDRWLAQKLGIRDTTLQSYIKPYNLYVKPEFGKLKLKDITYSDVVLFYKSLAQRGLSFSTIKNVNKVLSMVFDLMIRDGIVLSTNPTKGSLRELRNEYDTCSKDVKALTIDEQKAFEEFLRQPGRYHRYYPIFITLLWTGMRVGEVTALQIEQLDFENKVIHVDKTLEYYSKGKEGSAFVMNPPKTKKSNRDIPMLPIVEQALRMEIDYHNSNKIECVSEVDNYKNFVFFDDAGKILHYKKLNHILESIVKVYNSQARDNGSIMLPHIHNHKMRHCLSTRMTDYGGNAFATAEIMGHEEYDLTLSIYTDASIDYMRKEMKCLDEYFNS